MTAVDPAFDAVHPSGQLIFRSCRGGYLHSVQLGESAMDTDAGTLARAILLAARVSHLKAAMQVRQEIIEGGFTPSDQIAGPGDLDTAAAALLGHRLRPGAA